MRAALLPALGAVAAAAVLGACSSGGGKADSHKTTGGATGGNNSNSACQPQTVVISLCETFAITGSKTVSGTGVAIVPGDPTGHLADVATCEKWATGTPDSSDFPQLGVPNQNTSPVDGHKLEISWKMPAGGGTSSIDKYAGVNSLTIDGTGYLVKAGGGSSDPSDGESSDDQSTDAPADSFGAVAGTDSPATDAPDSDAPATDDSETSDSTDSETSDSPTRPTPLARPARSWSTRTARDRSRSRTWAATTARSRAASPGPARPRPEPISGAVR